jgi:hypothetical protein
MRVRGLTSRAVDRYLAALNTPKHRGRKSRRRPWGSVSRIQKAQVKTATGIAKALPAQHVRDLEAKLTQASMATAVDPKTLAVAFVKMANPFGENQNRGIGYVAWSDLGMSAEVLKRVGVVRTRLSHWFDDDHPPAVVFGRPGLVRALR